MVPVDGHQLVVTVMSAPQCNVTDLHNLFKAQIFQRVCIPVVRNFPDNFLFQNLDLCIAIKYNRILLSERQA